VKRFRVSISCPNDRNLEAKFFRANSAQEAVQMAKAWLGAVAYQCRISAEVDE